jgi:hydroxymethylpyrimidine/phosphomethylpyrimidine kinase
MISRAFPPLVLCISGQDPSGGAGIQADIEAIAAHGARAATLITCLTVQDSANVVALHPVDGRILLAQATTLLAEGMPEIVKIGLIGTSEILDIVVEVLALCPVVPLVFDPVLAAGGGRTLATPKLPQAIARRLLPRATLITPNRAEARQLAGLKSDADASAAAQGLLALGAGAVLLTGADEARGSWVENRLIDPERQVNYRWPRLPHRYHGSGCTLAASAAARLALGEPLVQAVTGAQRYTWNSLKTAFQPAAAQWFPRRIQW